jgi:hypothetical protein
MAVATFILASGLHGCGDVRQTQTTNPRSPEFANLTNSDPIRISGAIWVVGGQAAAYLDPVRREGAVWTIEGIALLGEAAGEVNGEPTFALSNTIEIDCGGQRYRKTAETLLSSDGRPLRRGKDGTSDWQDGLYPVLQWVCGDQSRAANGPRFNSMRELSAAYEDLGMKPKLTISGPTFVPSK